MYCCVSMGKYISKTAKHDMHLFRLVLHILIITECYHSITAIGLCDFEDRSSCKVCPKEVTSRGPSPNSLITEQPSHSHHISDQVNQVATSHGTADQVTISHETTHNAVITTQLCPPNMVYANCTTCQGTCGDPDGCIRNCTKPETCVCHDGFLFKEYDCVPEEQCECFIQGEGVLSMNETYVNDDCSKKCACENGVLNCDYSYTCSNNAICTDKNGVRQCNCNDGFIGDGELCIMYTDCYDAYLTGHRHDDVYTILPIGWPGTPFNVYCDMTGGGWTLFQRRTDGVTNFDHPWESYKHGFGFVNPGYDFWLGNENLHYITSQKNYTLRVDIITYDSISKYARFDHFQINNESTQYKIIIRGYFGTAGDGMTGSDGGSFSTYDKDNDGCENLNCATKHTGGWWYGTYWCPKCFPSRCHHFHYSGSCHKHCTQSNLNGKYKGGNAENIFWFYQRNCHLTFAEMKVRPS